MAAVIAALISAAAAEIPKHRAKQIRDAAPDRPQVKPARPRRVLIFNTPPHLMGKDPHKGYCIPYGTYAMKTLGRKTGAFTPVVSDDVAAFLPESLKTFDAIVLNNASGAWITPSDEAMKTLKSHGDTAAVEKLLRKSLLDFVRGGKGIVAYHYAMGGNRHWPAFRELLGAAYWGHPWHEEVGITVEEPDHPVLAAFGGKKTFRLKEEIFQFREPYSRDTLRVLLSLDVTATNMGVKWIHRKDNDFALAWVKPYGKGRVFYTAFGHRTEIYWNPTLLRFYLAGIQFAAGDLKAPCEPRATSREVTSGRRTRLAGEQRSPFVVRTTHGERCSPAKHAPAKHAPATTWGTGSGQGPDAPPRPSCAPSRPTIGDMS